ncbi:Aste57867_10230 [Aphanomyces stellatus]|uniref:Origin recognition complex subunit 2 n=1 Tax=Aphanomyces stellatus TaxID=120398 RepID=A0A485KPU4_9STRA|nr:hypothetical protein As57867_010191 [Aphanomyces stellatus]VFT87105.1 Aste57867_10230 [Aphanomyces stellatus]
MERRSATRRADVRQGGQDATRPGADIVEGRSKSRRIREAADKKEMQEREAKRRAEIIEAERRRSKIEQDTQRRRRKATGSDDEAEMEDADTDSSNVQSKKSRKSLSGATPARSPTERPRADIAPDPSFVMGNRQATDYFSSRKFRKKSKDDKKTAALVLLDADDILAALKAWNASHADPVIPKQLELHMQQFDRWERQLLAGFNLLITGFGSKLQLLQSLATRLSVERSVLQIHGYIPSVSIRYVVTTLFDKLFRKKLPPNRPLEEQCLELTRLLSASDTTICLVVHSIDGPALRSAETQHALSVLAASRAVHMVASVDHLNAAALWEEAETKRFGWLEHVAPSCAPYAAESVVKSWGGGGGKHAAPTALSGLKYILESLTPTDLSVLRALATEQLKGALVDHKPFVDLCRKAMLVSSVQGMRNALTCLTDHGLIVQSTTDNLRIPYGDHVLQHTILRQAMAKDDDDDDANDDAADESDDDDDTTQPDTTTEE